VRSLEAEHLTVLDGRTLNVCVPLPAGGASGVTGAWLRVGDRALPLEPAGARAFGTYVVEPVAAHGVGGRGRRWPGPWRRGIAGAAAGAGHGLDVIAVVEGERRELGVEVAEGGRRRRTAYGLKAPSAGPGGAPAAGAAGGSCAESSGAEGSGAGPVGGGGAGVAGGPRAGLIAGPTRLDPPHPDGWRLTVASPEEGHAAVLWVERLPPHAEVERVEPGWTEVAIHGRVVGLAGPGAVGAAPPVGGAAAGGGLVAELVVRGEAGAVCGLRTVDRGAGGFVAVLGGAELERLAGAGGERIWDVRVRSGGCAVPVGRLLGDVADPGRVHRLPNRLLIADSGDVVRVAPSYTAAGRLVVLTARVGGGR
jgi:hypothetical protein